ncbi:MAG: amidohydrolase family protein, partial [Pseudonocardiaceae bacterium]
TENAYAVRRDGSSIRKILSVPSSDEAVVSPKGTKVALTTHNRLYIAKVASAESALVDLTGGRQVAERGTATYVSWVNDDEVIWADGNEIRIANANNGEVSLLTKVSVSRTRKVAPGRCAVINAKIVTMRGGEIIEKGALGIEGGRIIAVEPMSRFHVSDYHCKIDASGATIIPGLMDVHAHVKSDDPSELSELWTHEFANYTAALAYGVTTSYDPSTITALGPIGISEMIDIGKILGPRVFSAGPPMYGDDGWESRSDYVRDRSQEDATEAIERRSGQVNGPLKEYSHPLRKQRRWMATAARRWQTPITAEGGDRITNLAFVLDGYTAFEHPIPVWPIGDDVAKLLAATSVGYTPIISSDGNGLPQKYVSRDKLSANIKFNRFTPAAEKRLKPVLGRDQKINDAVNFLMNLTAKNAARILSSGGMVSTGTHGGTWIGVHYEMEELVSGGASNHDALRAATIIPAKKLDIDHSLGSIEVGKIADLVVLDADPLKDIKATQLIRFVVKDGRIFDAASMSEIKELSKSSQGLGTASSYAGRIN